MALEHRKWSKEASKLRKEREQAKVLLMAGETVSDVSRAIGVNRVTVHRWLHEDEFKLVKESRQLEIARENNDAMRKALPVAWQTVMEEIVSGDGKLALQLLKETGALGTAGKAHGMAPEISATPQGIQIVIQQYGDNAQNGPKGVDNAQDVEAEVLDCDGD